MIIVKLMGGLGNQMFQYSAARRLALRHGTELKLDLSWLNNSPAGATSRRFELDHFNIAAEIASTSEVSAVVGHSITNRLGRLMGLFSKNGIEPSRRVIQEGHFNFDPFLLDAPDDAYLVGYWQSDKYFIDIADVIRQDLSFRTIADGHNASLAETIGNVMSVSVHVRRGDYVSNPEVNAVHGTCSASYYRAAMELIEQRVRNPHFFIFSDQMSWCRQHIGSSCQVTFVDHNGPDGSHDDLRLMSSCRHHIIANSSFSWWGAWLSIYPGKMVISPKRWFNDPSMNCNDLIPLDWLRV